MLVSLPYPFGPDLETCDLADGVVRVLWLLPITESEKQYKIASGLESLERRFEEAALEYWRPDRESAVLDEKRCAGEASTRTSRAPGVPPAEAGPTNCCVRM